MRIVPTTITLEQIALDEAREDHRVFPCDLQKRPLTAHGVLDATTDARQIRSWWRQHPGACVAVAMGDGRLVLDLDGPDALHDLIDLENELGALPATHAVDTPSDGHHLYLRYPPTANIRNSVKKLAPNIDVRADGGYVLIAGTFNGNPYIDHGGHDALAPDAWIERITAAPQGRSANAEAGDDPLAPIPAGRRVDILVALIGRWRAAGMTTEECVELARGRNAACCQPPLTDDEMEREVLPACARFQRVDAGVIVSGNASSSDDDEDDEDYDTAQAALPGFPTDLLPTPLRALVESESERLRLPPGMIALASLVGAAAAIGGARSVQTDDREHMASLWGVIIAETGAGKTPALDVALRPFRQANRKREEHRAQAFDLLKQTPRGGSPPVVPAPMLTTDVTTEGLRVLANAPRGLLIDADELSAWARGLGVYHGKGASPDRARYCSIWNSTTISVLRQGQPPTIVPRPIVSIIGGMQPAAIASLNATPDGLAQRFLCTVHPDAIEQPRSRAKPMRPVLDAWNQRTLELLALRDDFGSPVVLGMASNVLTRWQDGCDQRLVEQCCTADAPEVYRKFDAMSARLALVLALIDDPTAIEIPMHWVDVAWQLLFGYFGPHALVALAGTRQTIEHPIITYLIRRDGTATLRQLEHDHVGGRDKAAILYQLWELKFQRRIKMTENVVRTGGKGQVVITL